MRRLEILRRVYWRLVELGDDRLGEKDRAFIEEYHHELERLTEIGENVSEFFVRPDDWTPQRLHLGPIGASYYTGPLTGGEELVVSRTRFERRFRPAIRHVWWLIQQEEAKAMAEHQAKRPSAVVEERSRLLATLIHAYRQNQQPFHALASDGQVTIHHAALHGGLVPNRSHVEALAHDGSLILIPGTNKRSWTIGIPTQVLEAVETSTPDVGQAPSGKQRVEDIKTQIINYFNGGSHNVAAGSSHVAQTINHGVQPSDLNSLLTALQELGVSEADISDLETMVESPAPEDANRSIGDRAKAWFASYATSAIAGASGDGLVAAVERMPQIARSIEVFAGTG